MDYENTYTEEVKRDGFIIINVRKIKEKNKCEDIVNKIISDWLKRDLTKGVEIC